MQLLKRQNAGNRPDADKLARRLAQALQQWGEDLLKIDAAQFRSLFPLISALQQGQSLKELLQRTAAKTNELTTEGYPATSPLLVLRASLNSVWERNILPGWVETYTEDGVFSADRRWLVTLSGARGGRGYRLTAIHLYDLVNQQQFDLETPGNNVQFMPDSRRLLISGGETTRLLDLSTRKFTDLKLNPGFVRISPNGQYLINDAFEADRSFTYVYDLTGKQLAKLAGYFGEFRPKRQQMILIDRQNEAPRSVLYEFTGKRIGSVPGDAPRFSPNGNWLAVAMNTMTGNGSTVLYDLITQQRFELLGSLTGFSAQSDRLLTTEYRADTSMVYLYNTVGKQLAQLSAGNASFSPSGKRIAVTQYLAERQESAIYNSGNGQAIVSGLIGNFQGFSPDEQSVLLTDYNAQSQTDSTRLYSTESGQLLAVLQGGAYRNNFSPNGKYIVTNLGRRVLALHDRYGNLLSRLPGSDNRFSSDGKWLITQAFDHQVHLYDLATDQPGTFVGYQASFSPDATAIVTTQYRENESITLLYDLMGNEMAQLQGTDGRFSPDSQLLLTSNISLGTYLYDVKDKAKSQRLAELAGSEAQFTPDGKFILTFNRSEVVLSGTWYDRTGKALGQFVGVSPVFSANGKQMATLQYAQGDRTTDQSWLYDLATRQEMGRFEGADPRFSPNGQLLVTTLYNGANVTSPAARLYDIGSQRLIAPLNGLEPRFSPDSQAIAVSVYPSDRGSPRTEAVTILYRATGQEMAELKGIDARFSPTAQQVMVTSYQNDIAVSRLYDFTGKPLAQFPGAQAQFSPDGQRVLLSLSQGEDELGNSQLYDISGRLLAEIQGSFVGIRGDRTSFVTSQGDRTHFYTWAGVLLAEFPGMTQLLGVYDGANQRFPSQVISSDGRYLLTTWNEQVRLWRIDAGLDDLLNRGCQWLQAYLASHPELADKLDTCLPR